MFLSINAHEVINLNHIVSVQKSSEIWVVKLTDDSYHNVDANKVDELQKLMKWSNKATERVALGNF